MPKKKAPSERACSRLARHERQAIERMPDRGKGCREVARGIGRAPSTVADEAERRRLARARRRGRGAATGAPGAGATGARGGRGSST
ncbi:helix-turn-helix domain-containing protein, partial [Collinsella stercoris]|uniref:helix-turn-helix domain-containing protein n=1 Tax=Collinsella stercoris TaxID=147206 RepID=UPI003AF15529